MNYRSGIVIEYIFVLAIFIALSYAYWFTVEFGHYPPPFFYDASDTFMDWFNTAYWANNPGAYDTWKTLYPPLTFLFVRLFSIPSCYDSAEATFVAARTARDGCDPVGIIALFTILAVNFVLIAIAMYRHDPKTALPRTIALGLGLPMLHGLERGNLIIVTFTFFILAFGPFVKNVRLRWLFIAIAINFKIYLISAIFPLILRRKWRWFEGALLYTVLVYIFSALLLGSGSIVDLYGNITSIVAGDDTDSFLIAWLSATYSPFMTILNSNIIPITSLIGSFYVEFLVVFLPILQKIGQLLIVLAAAATALRPEAIKAHHVINLGVLLALITSEAGAYTLTIVGFFVFQEKWKGIARPIAIVSFYFLCIPGDLIIDYLFQMIMDSYIGGKTVVIDFPLTLGPFIRPMFLTIIAYAWAIMLLADVRRDFAANPAGWRRRFSQEPFAAR